MTAIKMIAVGKKLGNIYGDLAQPICKKYGINQSCFDVLMFCANNPENNTARDICAVRGIKSGIASVAVDTLIQKGFLKRTDDPDDRRIHRLVPTEKAKEIISDGRKMQDGFISTLKSGITPEEEEIFERVNEKILENVKLFGSEEK
ncbi:MAG TPA: MarR family transcriptional regulator [Ruminococcaceae bacterium]|nr:MarR family transcriptional regulator [Oscillospiraceae bacterium]